MAKLQDKIDGCLRRIEQNKNHVAKLELILRALHNDLLTVEDVRQHRTQSKVEVFVQDQRLAKEILSDEQASTAVYEDILSLFDNFDSSLLNVSPSSIYHNHDPSAAPADGHGDQGAKEASAGSKGADPKGAFHHHAGDSATPRLVDAKKTRAKNARNYSFNRRKQTSSALVGAQGRAPGGGSAKPASQPASVATSGEHHRVSQGLAYSAVVSASQVPPRPVEFVSSSPIPAIARNEEAVNGKFDLDLSRESLAAQHSVEEMNLALNVTRDSLDNYDAPVMPEAAAEHKFETPEGNA